MNSKRRFTTGKNGLMTLVAIASLSVAGLVFDKESKKLEIKKVQHIYPTEYNVVTSPYGIRNNRPHPGLDLRAYCGSKIFASADGKVVFAEKGKNGGFGNSVIIKHRDNTYTHYAHLDNIYVEKGNKVNAGETIALAGNTGLPNIACHLHYEVRTVEDYGRNQLWLYDAQGNVIGPKPVDDWKTHLNPENFLPPLEKNIK